MSQGTKVTLHDARNLFPSQPAVSTLLRRVHRGVRGVKLKAEFDGYRWWTTEEWVQEHLDRLNGNDKQFRRISTKTYAEKLQELRAK